MSFELTNLTLFQARAISNFVLSSTRRREEFRVEQVKQQPEKKLLPKRDIVTRWTATCEMLERVDEMSEVSSLLFSPSSRPYFVF